MRRRSFLLLTLAAGCSRSPAEDRSTVPWPADRAVASAELAKELSRDPPPRVVHVGPAQLFRSARVPSAIHTGEAGEDDGLAALERWLSPLARDTDVVLYCGCCPYKNCPNIRPAYRKAVALGFTRVRVLDLPTTFKADWAALGLPVERG